MLSNYLLLAVPADDLSAFIPALAVVQLVVLVVFVAAARRVVHRRPADPRAWPSSGYGEAQGGNMTIGFYAGSRAYLPRRWRLPGPAGRARRQDLSAAGLSR